MPRQPDEPRSLDRQVGLDIVILRFGRLALLALAVGGAVHAVAALVVTAEPELFEQLRRHVRGVLALRIPRAPEELAAPPRADDHRLAALVAVDVRRDRLQRRPVRTGGRRVL